MPRYHYTPHNVFVNDKYHSNLTRKFNPVQITKLNKLTMKEFDKPVHMRCTPEELVNTVDNLKLIK